MSGGSNRSARIAFQIWALIRRTGGDCTLHDMAEVTGESWQRCRAVCAGRGWAGAYRVTTATTEQRGDWGRSEFLYDHEGTLSAVAHYAGGVA